MDEQSCFLDIKEENILDDYNTLEMREESQNHALYKNPGKKR